MNLLFFFVAQKLRENHLKPNCLKDAVYREMLEMLGVDLTSWAKVIGRKCHYVLVILFVGRLFY